MFDFGGFKATKLKARKFHHLTIRFSYFMCGAVPPSLSILVFFFLTNLLCLPHSRWRNYLIALDHAVNNNPLHTVI